MKKIIWLILSLLVIGCQKAGLEDQFGDTNYQQVERLARPAVNEGLVITNDYLNAYNSIPPGADLSPAAAPVLKEAGSVLTALYNYGTKNGLKAPTPAAVVSGFIPDVMRVDTRAHIRVGVWAYNGDSTTTSSGAAMLTGGRKPEDGVMDITLSYFLAGNPACGPGQRCAIPQGTTYAGGTTCAGAGQGANPHNPGHRCLVGQSQRDGSAVFPFLAEPN